MNPKVVTLIKRARTPYCIEQARNEARKKYIEFPHNGCAAFLSCMLEDAGIDVPFTLGAQELGTILERRGWERAPYPPEPGDVLVSKDVDHNGLADHIALIASVLTDADTMMVCDNQSTMLHHRSYSGKDGKSPVDHLLRAPSE